MGRRGPKKTPTEVLERRGSRRAKERAGEIRPTGSAVCPAWLDGEAQRCWAWLIGELDELGLATSIDTNTRARWRRCQAVISQHGETYTHVGSMGQETLKKRPEVEIAGKLASELSSLESAFGLSPSARAGRMAPPAKEEEADALSQLKLVGARTA